MENGGRGDHWHSFSLGRNEFWEVGRKVGMGMGEKAIESQDWWLEKGPIIP